MRRSYAALLFAVMLLATKSVPSSAETADERNEVPKSVAQRIDAVKQELTDVKELPFWAGRYVEGDGLGMNVTLYVSPDAGVAFTNYGCLGLYGADEGTLSILPDGSLNFAFRRQQAGTSSVVADDVLPVRWGDRVYLLPRQRIYEFVLRVNRGFEQLSKPGGGRFLNNKKDIRGMPELPEPYRAALREKAVEAKVLRVTRVATKLLGKPMCEMRYEVTIDRGASSGLSNGEMLEVLEPKHAFASLTLEHVQDTQATGSISILEDDCKQPQEVPAPAWTLSTYAIGETETGVRVHL